MPTRRTMTSMTGGLLGHLLLGPGIRAQGIEPGASPVPGLQAAQFGAIGDGVTDDTAAIQRLLDAAAGSGMIATIPPGSYRLDGVLSLGSHTILHMHDATLLCYNPALGEGSYNLDQPMLEARHVESIVIEGGRLDGRKDAFGKTEFKSGIGIYGSSDISLRDITAANCKGDGFHISTYQAGPDDYRESRNVTMERCIADGNHRQGLSIISLVGGSISDCVFRNTAGTNPQSGVDIEPNLVGELVNDIVFERCTFDNNAGSGFIFSAVDDSAESQHTVTLSDCSMNGNGVWGVWITNGHSLTFERCTITSNGDTGFNLLVGENSDLIVEECNISENGVHGMLLLGYGEGGSIESMRISRCRIAGNSRNSPGHHMGLSVGDESLPTRFHSMIVTDNVIGSRDGTIQRYGVYVANASILQNARLSGNDLRFGNRDPVRIVPPADIVILDNDGYDPS